MKSMEGNSRIRPANGRSSRSAHGVGRERESEPRERERVGAGGWWEVARLQCGVRGWPEESSRVGTWWRPTNLGHGVVETESLRTVRRPKRTVREAGCYSLALRVATVRASCLEGPPLSCFFCCPRLRPFVSLFVLFL